jgi:hypothetical protein
VALDNTLVAIKRPEATVSLNIPFKPLSKEFSYCEASRRGINAHLLPQWKELYEQYSNRFIGIGTDMADPESWVNPKRYKDQITIFRKLLADLSAQTAEQISVNNAQKLFAIAPIQPK